MPTAHASRWHLPRISVALRHGLRRRYSLRRAVVLALAAGMWVFMVPNAGASPTSSHATKARSGGTVTFAEEVGGAPNYIFPLYPLADYAFPNTANLQNLLYQPLYWFGKGNTLKINEQLSMAKPPVYSTNDTTVTIHLKSGMKWSTGAPITSRDVEFWINLLKANKTNYGPWVPGTFPTDLKSADYPNARTVVLHLTASYSPSWFTGTGLAEITPLPQQVWDETSLAGPIGTYDTTTSGAVAVRDFLNTQSDTTGSYTSSPLWKVVDGPYRLLSNTSDGKFTFVPNPRYFGPKSHISKLVEVPFTSQAAENDALLTGSTDYGFISSTEIPEVSRLKREGYEIEPWPSWGINYLYMNYTNPKTAPFLKQQYVRIAMQELINEPQLIKSVFEGYAYPDYGPVPTKPYLSTYVAPSEKKATYPYDAKKAIALLKSHGWKVVPTGQTTCINPSKCGPGVTQGMPLTMPTVVYPTGYPAIDNMMRAIKSSMSTAGIQWTLRPLAISDIGTVLAPCTATGPCKWSAIEYNIAYYWDPGTFPDGGPAFGTGAALYEGTGPFSKQLDTLIQRVRTAPAGTAKALLYKYQTYVEKTLPNLWIPMIYSQISVIKRSLHGALPQNPVAQNMTPQLWTLGNS